MRRVVFFFFVLLVNSYFSFSQSSGLRIGGHFGIGEARIQNAGISNQTGKLCLQGGLAMNYQFTKNIGLYSNLLFTSKGSRANGFTRETGFFGYTDYPYEEEISLYYIELPLMLKGSIGLGNFHIKAFAGPGINFNLHGSEERIYSDNDYNQDHGYTDREINGSELIEYALTYGGGFDVAIAGDDILFLEIRESRALNSFGNINNREASNRYFTIGLGYLIKY